MITASDHRFCWCRKFFLSFWSPATWLAKMKPCICSRSLTQLLPSFLHWSSHLLTRLAAPLLSCPPLSPIPSFILSAPNRTVNDGAPDWICHCSRLPALDREEERLSLGVLYVSVFLNTSSPTADPSVWPTKRTHTSSRHRLTVSSPCVLCGHALTLPLFQTSQS